MNFYCPMSQPFLSVIIPARNEVKRIPLTLVDIDHHLSKEDFTYEIIVVVNGAPTDGTDELVEKFASLIPHLRVIKLTENERKGWAVKKGMLEARGKYRIFMDADNSTSIDQFKNMLPYFSAEGGSASGGKDGYDVVIGSRTAKGARLEPAQPLIRQIPGKLGNLFIQLLILPGIWDTQCGFKGFTEEAARRIFSLQKVNDWGFDVEILALAKRMGFKIKEMPVVWVNDPFSQVTPKAYLGVLWETVKIRYWLMRNSYNL